MPLFNVTVEDGQLLQEPCKSKWTHAGAELWVQFGCKQYGQQSATVKDWRL